MTAIISSCDDLQDCTKAVLKEEVNNRPGRPSIAERQRRQRLYANLPARRAASDDGVTFLVSAQPLRPAQGDM